MRKNNVEVLILPDIHGRRFWKDAIERFPKNDYPNIKIVFLGDYVDPYVEYDGITQEEAFVNFEELLDYVKTDNRVTILLGNHDWHYIVVLDHSRYDWQRKNDIHALFMKNIDMFQFVKILEYDGCKYMFSHAGLTKGFVEDSMRHADEFIKKLQKEKKEYEESVNKDDLRKAIEDINECSTWLQKISNVEETEDYETFNETLRHIDDGKYWTYFPSVISRARGGYARYGSFIWEDAEEYYWEPEELKGFYQIFGHTYIYPNGTNTYAISPEGKSFAMLDCGKAFVMDIEGNIEEISKVEE